jgi:hypothetical protein
LTEVSRAQGLLLGRQADVGPASRDQASLAALTEDVVKTSEIEGESLDVASVRPSVARPAEAAAPRMNWQVEEMAPWISRRARMYPGALIALCRHVLGSRYTRQGGHFHSDELISRQTQSSFPATR